MRFPPYPSSRRLKLVRIMVEDFVGGLLSTPDNDNDVVTGYRFKDKYGTFPADTRIEGCHQSFDPLCFEVLLSSETWDEVPAGECPPVLPDGDWLSVRKVFVDQTRFVEQKSIAYVSTQQANKEAMRQILDNMQSGVIQIPRAVEQPVDAKLIERAWGIIANVSNGDWKLQSEDWQEAAADFRDGYNAYLSARNFPDTVTTGRLGCCTPQLCHQCGPDCGGRKAFKEFPVKTLAMHPEPDPAWQKVLSKDEAADIEYNINDENQQQCSLDDLKKLRERINTLIYDKEKAGIQ